MDTRTLTFHMRGSSKHCSRTSQKYTSWKSDSRIAFSADVCLHNLFRTWSMHRNFTCKFRIKYLYLLPFTLLM